MKKILQRIAENSLSLSDEAIEGSEFLKSFLKKSCNNQEIFSYYIASEIQKRNWLEYKKTAKYLSTDIQYLKGVGPKRALLLKSRGISKIEDILNVLPNGYRDLSEITSVKDAATGYTALFKVRFKFSREVYYNRRKVLEAVYYDSTGTIVLKWFNFKPAYLKKYFNEEKEFVVYGKVSFFSGSKEIVHPVIEEFSKFHPRIMPVYPAIGSMTGKVTESLTEAVLQKILHENYEYIPANILICRGLEEFAKCYGNLHFPSKKSFSNREKYLKRLIYEEFFFTMLAVSKEKARKKIMKTEPVKYKGTIIAPFLENLPFELTESQKKVLREIFKDFKDGKILNRLLQGDVGSGKTLVALICALLVIENKGQAALMAPTEILAEQHYKNFQKYDIPIKMALLTGSTGKKTRENIYKQLAEGEIDLIVGTHALIVENVIFKNLKLNIIDEQHKFGVRQRLFLKEKGSAVHTLIMTATPIPRTLTLTLYGDLDVSVIDKLPPGRKPVKTYWFRENMREHFVKKIKIELAKGRQAFFVYPLIEESDKISLKSVTEMEQRLKDEFSPDFSVQVLHGKMKPAEKEEIMKMFANGEADILVSTTVIEVGIDVPNATVIVIENAERFGLSQLHQLRGRVGRGKEQALCFLVSGNKISQEASERLKVMVSTTDGFKISEADFKIRGSGEIAGTKQSGLSEFKFADLIRDFQILLLAKEDAEKLVEFDPELEKFPALKDKFEKFMGERKNLVSTG